MKREITVRKRGSYTLVLTHDVDNLSLRSYPVFSRMTFSFLKRCLWNNMVRAFKRDISFRVYLDSIKWAVLYPLVKFGIIADPWERAIYETMALEKKYGVYSTFFFIPFPDRPGSVAHGVPAPKGRATAYDIRRYKGLLQDIESRGWEVGVHGIDAHLGVRQAREEIEVMRALLPFKKEIGLRMHWLYQTKDLWKNLRESGFCYDATFGANGEVGFPEGIYSPFRRDGLWVIPVNIMDSTLLGYWRRGLSQRDAWIEIENILDLAGQKNAVVTVLWHTNTSAAFYYWGEVYEKILNKAVSDGAKVMRCIDICNELEKVRAEGVSCQGAVSR
jgi:peptidoglycan/xylan/chitin deacetylase (PgdA/CDA1 family)